MLRFQLLPKPKDLLLFLDAARDAAEDRYQEPKYAYVREALCKIYDNCPEWLEDGLEPNAILLEALQDERTVLDKHNRMQAKHHPEPGLAGSIPDELVSFPLRFMCLQDGDIILPTGFFEPIYQAKGGSKSPKPAAHNELTAANRQYSIGKLADAPSPTHDFPDSNITLVEIAAFLPQSIKSWDVADRIIWNGAMSEDLAVLSNKYRGLNPAIQINSVYRMFSGQMRKRTEAEHGYKEWDSWIVSAQAKVNKPAGFNANSISVTSFRRPVIFKGKPNVPAVPIPFKNLANGVAVWPEEYDALDLTRCVRWCVDHPEEEYYYPTDYQAVLERLGGPLTPDARHSDASALARLRSDTGRSSPRRRAAKDYRYGAADSDEGNDESEFGKRKRKQAPSSRAQRAKRRKNNASSPVRQTRAARSTAARSPSKKTTLLDVDSEEDTDDDAYEGPKRMTNNKDAPRRSGRNKSKATSYVDLVEDDGGEEDEEAKGEEEEQYNDAGYDEDESEDEEEDMYSDD